MVDGVVVSGDGLALVVDGEGFVAGGDGGGDESAVGETGDFPAVVGDVDGVVLDVS